MKAYKLRNSYTGEVKPRMAEEKAQVPTPSPEVEALPVERGAGEGAEGRPSAGGAPTVGGVVEELIREIEPLLDRNVVVIEVSRRTAFSYYNYKKQLLVVFKPLDLPWEEADPRSLKIIEVSAGVYQDYPVATAEILEEELSKRGYVVHRIDVF
jgi:hypothetical protein